MADPSEFDPNRFLANGLIIGAPICPVCGNRERGMIRVGWPTSEVIAWPPAPQKKFSNRLTMYWECAKKHVVLGHHKFALHKESHFTHCVHCEGRGYFECQDKATFVLPGTKLYDGRVRWTCRECNGRGWRRV